MALIPALSVGMIVMFMSGWLMADATRCPRLGLGVMGLGLTVVGSLWVVYGAGGLGV